MTDFFGPEAEITNEQQYRDFVRWLIKDRKVAYHPDNSFSEYVDKTDNRTRTFTREQAARLDELRRQSFFLLGDKVYSIGLEEYRMAQKPDKCKVCGSDYEWNPELQDWIHVLSLIGH